MSLVLSDGCSKHEIGGNRSTIDALYKGEPFRIIFAWIFKYAQQVHLFWAPADPCRFFASLKSNGYNCKGHRGADFKSANQLSNEENKAMDWTINQPD